MDISGKLLELVNSATGGNGVISIIVSLVMLVIGFVMLIKGADMFVDGASKVAVKLKVPMIVIGLTIVAFGTSAPEAAISITSAWGRRPAKPPGPSGWPKWGRATSR